MIMLSSARDRCFFFCIFFLCCQSVTASTLTINNTTPAAYSWALLQPGTAVYVDRDYTYATPAPELLGAYVLQTANDDKQRSDDPLVEFNIDQQATVYVAFDVRLNAPSWLSDWTQSGLSLNTTDTTLALYHKSFPAGLISLGSNGADFSGSMYTVVIQHEDNQTDPGSGSSTGESDTDNDGIADDWELNYFNDLTIAGSLTDFDEDGLLDIKEWSEQTAPDDQDTDNDGDNDHDEVKYGSDPNDSNDVVALHAPQSPVLAIASNPLPVSDVKFTASAFADPDGDPFAASHWQIDTQTDFNMPVFDRVLPIRTFTLSAGILDLQTAYTVRVRYRDASGLWSPWSAVQTYMTADTNIDDADGNMTEDAFQLTGSIDMDRNNINDLTEDSMCVMTSADQAIKVAIRANAGNVDCVHMLGMDIMPWYEQAKIQNMPLGLAAFRIRGISIGATVTLTWYSSEVIHADSVWMKYDPVLNTITAYQDPTLSINGDTVTMSLTDGGPGDHDGVANGVIIDPSGPGTFRPPSNLTSNIRITVDDNTDPSTGAMDFGLLSGLGIIFLAAVRRSVRRGRQRVNGCPYGT